MTGDSHTEAQDFLQLMDLEPHGPDVFVGISPVYPWGRLYGGQVVAQALRAAAYFIRGGTSAEPVRYEVDRIRNGRSFVTRRVVARQSNGAILNLSASFHVEEDQPESQTFELPQAPKPGELTDDGWGFLLDRRLVPLDRNLGKSMGWVRLVTDIGDDPTLHACGLAFSSDTVQFGAARAAHPVEVADERQHRDFIGASLDHAMWFHRPGRADEFHLYDFTSHGLIGGRGLVTGQLFDEAGVHVASVAQEVLLRFIGDSDSS